MDPFGDMDMYDDFPCSPGGNRKPAVKGRITGEIIEWRGKFGWIQPDSPIDHPEARMKGGKIYLSQEDVAEVISGVGAKVSYYVYCDGTGLGAMMCVPIDSPTASKPFVKKVAKATPKPKPKAKAIPGRKRVSETMLTGKVKSWRGGFGFVTPSKPVDHPLFTGSLFLAKSDVLTPDDVDVGKPVKFYLYTDPQGLGAEECVVVEGGEEDIGDGSASPPPTNILDIHSSSTLLKARPKGGGLPPPGGSALATPFTAPTAKAKAMMRATPKAASAVRGDAGLAAKMAEFPELAKRLSAWMFDPGG